MGRRELVGRIISNAMNKTVLVSVTRTFRHAKYPKLLRKTKNFMTHDESNVGKVGDTVRIQESRPLSARKRWVLLDVVRQASVPLDGPRIHPSPIVQARDARLRKTPLTHKEA